MSDYGLLMKELEMNQSRTKKWDKTIGIAKKDERTSIGR